MMLPPPRPRHRPARSALFLALLLASGASFAQQSPALDRVSVWLGGYDANIDTTIGASDKSNTYSGDFNLERDLGFDDRKGVPRARLDFLVGDSQGFSLDYYGLKRTRSKSLGRSISYAGNDYSAAATVRGKLDFDFGSAAYRWWFGQGNDVFGLGVGGAYYRIKTGISGEASVNGEPVGQASASSNDSAWAPMLQLGWRHAFNDQWRMYFDASGVKKNGGRLNGHIVNAALGVEWFPWQHVGLGAEYGYSRIVLHQRKQNYNANLDMKLDGPSLFVRFRF
ncbi:MAG: autotransporter outer membrane beta-barrel domain-containing protein [Rhodanobacter sp.]